MLDHFTVINKVLEILRSRSEESIIQEKLNEVLAKIDELSIVRGGITDANSKLIFSALKNNKKIHTINLAFNEIGEGVKYLSKILQVKNAVRDINLSYNGIGENIVYLVNAIRENSTVQILDLHDATMPIKSKYLVDILEHNNSLHKLRIKVQELNEKNIEKITYTIKFCNITITSLQVNRIEHKEYKPYLEQNKKIALTISDLVKKNAELPDPLYNNVVKTIKARSMSEYHGNFFQYMRICKDIYQNNSDAEISSCPPEILYKIVKISTEWHFESKYDITPTVCRVTLPAVLQQMRYEVAEASAVSR